MKNTIHKLVGREHFNMWRSRFRFPLQQTHGRHLPHFWNCNWLEDLRRRRAQKRANFTVVLRLLDISDLLGSPDSPRRLQRSRGRHSSFRKLFFPLSDSKTPKSRLLPFYWLLETIAALRFARLRNTTGLVRTKPRLLLQTRFCVNDIVSEGKKETGIWSI